MFTYIIKRILAAVPVLIVVAVFVFLLMHLGSGDPAAILAGELATPEQIEKIRLQLGLNLPLYEQFFRWVVNLANGDFGESIYTGQPVTKLILQRLEPTLMLAMSTMIVAIAVAVPFGILAAWKINTWIDRLVMVVAVLAFSFPVFLVGYALVYLFSLELRLLPVQGYISIGEDFWSFLRHMILPSTSLGLIFAALIARITRASMIEILREDYIRTARSKGLPERRVVLRHALKNASIPIVTIIGIGFASVISGVVVTESVFAIPGLGRLTANAILQKDYPIIQAVVLLFSFIYVLLNLLVDIAYTFLDPRIRY